MLTLPVELTQTQARTCLESLSREVGAQGDAVVVDAAPLARFDSSALAVLLELRRECARAGKAFVVQGLPQRLRELAGLYGVDKLLAPA